jgi:Pyruvate/2-oxoacid:ferredoxin oxidoreductase delta subunit
MILVQHLNVFPRATSVSKLKKILGLDRKTIKQALKDSLHKLFVIDAGSGYSLPIPLFIYDAPFIANANYSGEHAMKFAQLSRQFFEDDQYYRTWETSKKGVPRMRVLTVSEEISPETTILADEEIYSLLDRTEAFAIIPCPCRQRTEQLGTRQCKDKYPVLNCVLLGPFAQLVGIIEDPIIKMVSRDEVKKLVKIGSDLGLVHATDNSVDGLKILCSCCECCCGMLVGITKFDNLRAIAKANYIPEVSHEKCVGCGTCVERCKFDAMTIDSTLSKSVLTESKCLGCGLCAVKCLNDAIQMVRLEREVIPGQK